MREKRRGHKAVTVAVCLCVAAALSLMTVYLSSCGSGTESESSNTGAKLPPGVEESDVTKTASTAPSSSTATTSTEAQSSAPDATTTTASSTPSVTADLAGARFTVVGATRPDTNKSVLSSSGREVKGDYLEVEFTMDNVGDDLVDLSDFSFRLESTGIAASTYEDYYGQTGTYGVYVDEDEISASLLDYSSLATVTYLMKIGEHVDKVFCFFDLNPESTAKNAEVTKDNSTLVIRKVSGTDYGEQVTIPLAGYPD